MQPAARSPLPLYLAGAYTLLAIYGSLYPFAGWHDSGAPLTEFLTAGWPRYGTAFDLAVNLAAYLPLGFLWVAALAPRLGSPLAVAAAVLTGSGLSLGLETLQNFLPSRVPSNLDLACNGLGSLLGALAGARWGASLVDGGKLHRLRLRLFVAGPRADAGLLLLWLWLLAQLNPETLLFGNGDLRTLLDLAAPLPYSAGGFARVEAAVVATHTLAFALLAGKLTHGRLLVPALLGAGLAAKSFAYLLLMNGRGGLVWATPGSLAGLAIGLLLWLAADRLPGPPRRAVAALALLLAAVLVNLAPENPYLANTYQVWDPGHFLNFHGLTQLTASLWPYLALPWLMLLKPEKR